MKLISNLADMIDEEIVDAMKYAKCSLTYKEDDPELSKAFSQLAYEELGHVERLHTQVVRIINKYKAEHGDPPKHMQTIYDYLHERNIQKVADVRLLLS